MPGVLVETGFLTNASDRKVIGSDSGQVLVATAIFKAVKKYKGK